MLTIHSGINRNVRFNTSFGTGNRSENYSQNDIEMPEDEVQISEMDKIKEEYERERASWLEQKHELEDMIKDKEAQIPKPVKTAMKGGAIFAAGVLGGMATGYSAKYIMNTFQKMYNSKPVQKAVKGFSKNISAPVKKGFGAVKTFAANQLAKIKKSKTYTSGMNSAEKKFEAFKNTGFVKTIKKYSNAVANNKVVKSVTGFVDKVFSKFADCVVAVRNKLAKVNYKDTTADALGVAGGVSTGAITLMESKDKESAEVFETNREMENN